MSPYLAYALGILTFFIPLIVFYVLALTFNAANSSWNGFWCPK